MTLTPTAVDLPDVLAIDAACFEPQWYKDESVLGPAIIGEAPAAEVSAASTDKEPS